MAQQNIDIIIEAQDKTAQAFSSAKSKVESFSDRLENVKPAFQAMATSGAIAFGAISALAIKSINDFAGVEKAQRQLEHAIIAVSGGTKEQVARVNELTSALQKKAGVDADSLNMGVAQLSTFGLQTDSVIKLTKSLADLTVNQNGLNATSDAYISNANVIAKALRGEFGMLQKMGIRFTEAQQELILYGTEAQKVSTIQEGLAQNLRETTDTVSGVDLVSAKLRRTMEDISESVGKALVPAFNQLMEKVQPIINNVLAWIEANPKLFSTIIIVAGAIALLTAGIGALGIAFIGLSAVTAPVWLAFGAVAVVIAGIVLAFTTFKDQIQQIYTFLQDTGVLQYFKDIWENISTTFRDILVPQFQLLWEKLQPLMPLFQAMGQVFGVIILGAVLAVSKALEGLIGIFTLVLGLFTRIAAFLVDVFAKAFTAVSDAVQWVIDKVEKLISAIRSFIEIAKEAGLGSAIGKAVGKIFKVNDAVVNPNGNIISTHPDDYLIATKDPSSLGGAGGTVININGGTYLSEDSAREIGNMIIGNLNLNMRGS